MYWNIYPTKLLHFLIETIEQSETNFFFDDCQFKIANSIKL